MDEDNIERLVKEDIRIGKENNKILKKVYRYIKWNRAFRIFYWLIVIGSALGIYWFVEPYIEGARSAINTSQEIIKDPGGFIQESFFQGGDDTTDVSEVIEVQ